MLGSTRLLLALVSAALGAQAPAPGEGDAGEPRRTNVLFVVVDDLRPELGCYGAEGAASPRLDALAREGFVFRRAYCQQALCAPSRASVLTGRRPDATGVRDIDTHFRDALPDVVTLPQHFAAHGWRTAAVGKVDHDGLLDEPSWSEGWSPDTAPNYSDPATLEALGKRSKGPAVEAFDADEATSRDGINTRNALERLRALKDERFFLAVGYRRPHLPFSAPRADFERHERDGIALPAWREAPRDAPRGLDLSSRELRAYAGMPRFGPVGDDVARELVHGYRACVSFVDRQIGILLDELERLGLADDTLVVVWGDHGFKLGEYAAWGKQTSFEVDARVPLIVRPPRHDDDGGGPRTVDGLVELVDLYPTLCELAGLPLPEGLEGTSFAPLLDDPARPWKRAAFTQAGKAPGFEQRSLRTARWRYTRWTHADGTLYARELYDHEGDPGETVNLAGDEGLAEVVAELDALLAAGPRAALPPVEAAEEERER